MSNLNITKTTPDQDLPVSTDATVSVITVQTRKPTTYWSVNVQLPDTSMVCSTFRPFVDACLAANAESILYKYIADESKTKEFIPSIMLSHDALTSATTSTRMTADNLVSMWKASTFFKTVAQAKLNAAKATGDNKRWLQLGAAIERNETRLRALTSKEPERKLSDKDLDNILINISEADFDTPFGAYVAERVQFTKDRRTSDDDAI